MNGWGLICIGFFLILPVGGLASYEGNQRAGVILTWIAVVVMVVGLVWGVGDLIINGVP